MADDLVTKPTDFRGLVCFATRYGRLSSVIRIVVPHANPHFGTFTAFHTNTYVCQSFGRMNLKSEPGDNELLRSMLAGDEEALALLYRRRQGNVYRFALQMSGSKPIAEDVTQEVFLFLMREGHVFDPERGTVSAFLLGVARNHV